MWKSSSGMLINPRVVFTFTRQRWRSTTTFSSLLILPLWTSKTYSHLSATRSIEFLDLPYSTLPSVVGKMTTFDLWPIPLGGGAWGAGTNMWHPEAPASFESLPASLATQIPTLWIHTSGGRGRGGALILDRCRAFDLFASVDAHLCLPSSLSLRSVSPFLFNCLRLLASAVVPGGTWRVATPSSRRRRRLSCRLSGRPGRTRRPDLILLRANFGRRPSSLNAGDLIYFWRPCIPTLIIDLSTLSICLSFCTSGTLLYFSPK